MKKFGPTPQLLVLSNQTLQDSDQDLESVISLLQIDPNWQSLNWSSPDFSHPDVQIINRDLLGIKIEQVRTVIADCAYPPYQASERLVILLQLNQASIPAQQALLKFFEEPPRYVRIIATTNQLSAILPTIQSRSIVQVVQPTHSELTTDQHTNFIKQLLTNQLSFAELIAETEQYTERATALNFLQKLLHEVHSNHDYPNQAAVITSQHITENWLRLHHNTNVRLTLENCFFTIKKKLSQLQ